MISICCCALNAKFEVKNFVEALHLHNPGVEFEVVLTLDDRVQDGSMEFLKDLQQEYPNLVVVSHTYDDTLGYLDRLLAYYDKNDLFSSSFRSCLRSNLEKYKQGQLFDPTKSYLWMTSGVLYNKAVRSSCGDIIIVSPSDYIYLYGLRDLESYVTSRVREGLFYSKPNGLLSVLSNMSQDELQELADGPVVLNRSFGRDLRRSIATSDLSVVDFSKNRVVSVADPNFLEKMGSLCCRELSRKDPVTLLRAYHGQHIMTRQTWKAIGGFTEEFYGRAWPDDKMSALGSAITGSQPYMPPRFSFSLCSSYHVRSHGIPEELFRIDPYASNRPLDWLNATYLHDGYDKNYIHNLPTVFDKVFGRAGISGRQCDPVRIARQ